MKKLSVGDRVQFKSIPKEWSKPGFRILGEDVEFMKLLIRRKRKFVVSSIDEYGIPWIVFHIKINGMVQEHSWGIFEKTGWIRS